MDIELHLGGLWTVPRREEEWKHADPENVYNLDDLILLINTSAALILIITNHSHKA